MHNLFKKPITCFKTHRHIFTVVMVFLICSLGLTVAKPVYADVEGWLFSHTIGPVLLFIIRLLGKLLIAIIQILIGVAQYQDFIHATAVVKGWVILRDVCNMFFIVILLVIAFSTTLGLEKYHYKKFLPKLLLMAIFINFSKLIAGLFIDMAQVVMMTFVEGFKYAAAGNLTTAFGLDEMLKFRETHDEAGGVNLLEVMGALVLAVAMLLIALAVTTVIVAVLIMRIIALWILVVLSPIAYFAAAVPGGEKYSSMWWTKFSNYVITGPVLAFFLWLSFAIMAANPGNVGAGEKIIEKPEEVVSELERGAGQTSSAAGAAVGTTINVAASRIASSDKILSFIISIAMLIGALAATQQLGVAGAKMAGSLQGKISDIGRKALRAPTALARRGLDYAGREIAARTGVELRPGKVYESIKAGLQRRAEQREREATGKKGELLQKGGIASKFAFGAPAWVDQYLRGFLGWRGILGPGSLLSLRGAPSAKRVAGMEEKLKEKEGEKDKIKERLKKGTVIDDYIKELGMEAKGSWGEAKALDNQIGDITGENMREEATKLRGEAQKARDKGDEIGAKNLEARADDLEVKADEQAGKLRVDTELQRKVDELRRKADEAGHEAEAARIRSRQLREMRKTDPEAAENAARDDLNHRREKIEQEIERIKQAELSDEERKRRGELPEEIEKLIKTIADKERMDLDTDDESQKLEEKKAEQARIEAKVEGGLSKEEKEQRSKLTKEIEKLKETIADLKNNGLDISDESKELKAKRELLGQFGTKEWQQTKVANLEADRVKLAERTSGTALSPEEKEALQAEFEKAKKETEEIEDRLKKLRAGVPRDYYARQAVRQARAEEMRKIDTEEEDELIDLFENALARGEKTLASAIVVKLASCFGLNTLVNNHGYNSDMLGLNDFTNKVLKKKLHMSEQEAWALENDLCEAATQANHLTFSKGIMPRGGQFFQQGADPRSRMGQQYHAYVEMNKIDKETVARRFNRLGYGYEYPGGVRPDYDNFEFNPAGLWWLRDNWSTIDVEIGRGRFNANAAQSFIKPRAMSQLRDLVRYVPPNRVHDYLSFLNKLAVYGSSTTPSAEDNISAMMEFFR